MPRGWKVVLAIKRVAPSSMDQSKLFDSLSFRAHVSANEQSRVQIGWEDGKAKSPMVGWLALGHEARDDRVRHPNPRVVKSLSLAILMNESQDGPGKVRTVLRDGWSAAPAFGPVNQSIPPIFPFIHSSSHTWIFFYPCIQLKLVSCLQPLPLPHLCFFLHSTTKGKADLPSVPPSCNPASSPTA